MLRLSKAITVPVAERGQADLEPPGYFLESEDDTGATYEVFLNAFSP